jgi:hypothetical protein
MTGNNGKGRRPTVTVGPERRNTSMKRVQEAPAPELVFIDVHEIRRI